MTAITSRYADDPGMATLLHTFVRGLKARCTAIEKALQGGENETALRLAHQLKGAAGLYGFLDISEAAAALEAAVDGRDAPEPVAAKLAQILALCERARAPSTADEDTR